MTDSSSFVDSSGSDSLPPASPTAVGGARVTQLHTNRARAFSKGPKKKPIAQKTERAIASGDIQAVIDSLTQHQRRFVEEYLNDANMNASEAVRRCGYKTNNPRQIGFQLMENPAIRIAIDHLRIQRNDHTDVTKDYVLRKIVATIEKAERDNNHTAVLRGSELLAKHLGMFIERTEISGPDGEAIKMERKIEEDVADFTSNIARLGRRAS